MTSTRRTSLANSIAGRAKIGGPKFGYVGDDFVRNVVSVRVEAIVCGIKKFAIMIKARDCSEAKDAAANRAAAMLPRSLIETLITNPNIVGPKGKLPK